MAESEYTSLPNILWKIQKYSTCRKTFCTLSFLGTSWKLIFHHILDGGEKKIMIRLKCLNASENLKTLELWAHACIFYTVTSKGDYLPVKTKMNLKDEEWCVWSHPLQTTTEYFGSRYVDLWFSLKIFPEDMNKLIMTLEKIKQPAEEEEKTCSAILINDLAQLYNNSEHSDFELRCKEWRVPVHKAILSARSGYFAALFRSRMKEVDKRYVEFHDIEPETLRYVIYYLYSGKFPELPGDSIREVYAIADRFDIESLRMKCASLVMADFMKEHQTDTENDVSCVLMQVFRSSKWKLLSEENPALAEKMVKPILLEVPSIKKHKNKI